MNSRIIFFGFGSIAKQHIKILKSINPKLHFHIIRKNSNITSVDKKITFHNNIKNIKKLSQIKMGFVCSPYNFHFKHINQLINHNINIFVEKPFLKNLKELRYISTHSKKRKLFIQTGFLLRLNPAIEKIKKIIKSKKYGEIVNIESNFTSYLPNWRSDDYSKSVSAQKKYGGGVINELVHEIDYLNNIFGNLKYISKYSINSSDLKTNVEERAFVFLKTLKNKDIFLKLSFNEKLLSRYLFINFSKGSLLWNLIKNEIIEKKVISKKFLSKKIKIKKTFKDLKKIQIKKFITNVKNKKFGIDLFNQEKRTIKILNEIKKK